MSDWPSFEAELGLRLQREFEALIATLGEPEEALRHRPTRGSWSALEVAEHVALANHFLGLLGRKLAAKGSARRARGATPPSAPSALAHLDALATRSFRWAHPRHMTPTGTARPAELAARLEAQREELRRHLVELAGGAGALHRIRISVVDGDDRLDFYQWLHFVLLHVARHRAQIESALVSFRRAPGPPAS